MNNSKSGGEGTMASYIVSESLQHHGFIGRYCAAWRIKGGNKVATSVFVQVSDIDGERDNRKLILCDM